MFTAQPDVKVRQTEKNADLTPEAQLESWALEKGKLHVFEVFCHRRMCGFLLE